MKLLKQIPVAQGSETLRVSTVARHRSDSEFAFRALFGQRPYNPRPASAYYVSSSRSSTVEEVSFNGVYGVTPNTRLFWIESGRAFEISAMYLILVGNVLHMKSQKILYNMLKKNPYPCARFDPF